MRIERQQDLQPEGRSPLRGGLELELEPAVAAAAHAFVEAGPESLPAVERLAASLFERLDEGAGGEQARAALFVLLDAVRRRGFAGRMSRELAAPWGRLLTAAVERSDYTVCELIRARARAGPDVEALRVLAPEPRTLSVGELLRRTRAIARGLLALIGDEPGARVAMLAENSLDTALCDLACLSNGIVNVPLPVNAVPGQLEYMLRHSGAEVLLAGDEEQLAKVLPSLRELPRLKHVVVLAPSAAARRGLPSLEALTARGAAVDEARLEQRARTVRSRDLATVMYTSGTTGLPKGICFSHLNLVSKRYCRGLALPLVGEGDLLLSYLPLFHTFGRWLELFGAIHWGATYVFARSPSRAVLLEDFRAVRPTVFISVPKKWMELHEQARREAGGDDPDLIAAALARLTGGRLRFGLSAAGHLDPSVFRAVRRAGIELCSGYGMTEATGGVTMTPPGEFVDDSIGVALPGIELSFAEDGELKLRGPYVMTGYLDPPDGDRGLDAEGWFATGDLVRRDDGGHLRIVGRKKEIYKNRSGQTIAPQRIENLFRDFDAIGQSFVVGDHREYNTLLVWPGYERQPALREKSPEELRALVGSLVATANRFLAPFERIVAFTLLDRPLTEAQGELTPKGSFRREVVEAHFRERIEAMYQSAHLAVRAGALELRVPHWVLREIGVLREELVWAAGRLAGGGRTLTVRESAGHPGWLRIGDYRYGPPHGTGTIDLGALLAAPAAWLGNAELRAFVGEEAFASFTSRRRDATGGLEVDARGAPAPDPARVAALLDEVAVPEVTAASLHAAAVLARAPDAGPPAEAAVAHLGRGLSWGGAATAGLCRALLRRLADAPAAATRREALFALIRGEEPGALLATLRRFLAVDPDALLGPADLGELCERGLPAGQLEALVSALEDAAARGSQAEPPPADRRAIIAAMKLLAAWASANPTFYARVRTPLSQLALRGGAELAARAAEELDRVHLAFRAFIGPNERRAVDPQTGRAYGWREAIEVGDEVSANAREVLLRAIEETPLVREAVYLFGRGARVGLSDVAPGAARLERLAAGHGKSVYRLSLQTRAHQSFDLAVNLAENEPVSELREEVRWLQAAGAPPPLVEAFGGYHPEHGIFTEEYVAGETVEQQIERLAADDDLERLQALWPFHVWSAIAVHAAFWERTGSTLAVSDPSPASVIAPSHDYQSGTRLVAISPRSECTTGRELLERLRRCFLEPVLADHPELEWMVAPGLLYSGFVESLGETRAAEALASCRESRDGPDVEAFLSAVRRDGYTPMRVFFATRRYRRWLSLNPQATLEARAATMQEIAQTYQLAALEERWPDSRVRFFRRTVFAEARPAVAASLERLMACQRAGTPVDLAEQLAQIRAKAGPEPEEDFFLARLAWRHLAPTDEAALVSLREGERRLADVSVTFGDARGGRFSARGPVSPREVARLLEIFHEANLPVAFGPDHEFLLALDAKDVVVGGLYYRRVDPARVHLEKIVVARSHRRRGIAEALVGELLRRLQGRGVRVVETGFFHPRTMRRFGFRLEPRYGGLIRDLAVEGAP